MITVRFGDKKFMVSKDKIYTPDGISISESLSTEETAVSGKKPNLKIKGIGLQTISMNVHLDCRFVDIDTELRFWKSTLLKKKSYTLEIGSFQVGHMYLTAYDISDIILANNGNYTSAKLKLTFTEDGKNARNKKYAFNFNEVMRGMVAFRATSATNTKATVIKKAVVTIKKSVRKGSTIKPKSGARWYYTAEGALKKTGKSGKAYQKTMKVTYTYAKNGKIVCVNPSGLGWLKVEDVNVVKY